MSPVFVEDGRLVIDPEATSIELPIDITIEFLDAVFACSPGEPGHIAELFSLMRQTDKERFRDACDAAGIEYAKHYSVAAVNWAAVGSETGEWELNALQPIVARDIHSWLIDHLYADKFGFWYAVCRDAKTGATPIVLSDVEFHARYGDSFADHLRKIIEFLPIRLNQMIDAMEKTWVNYNLTLMRDGRIVTETQFGPPNIPPKEWLLPKGTTFLSAELA